MIANLASPAPTPVLNGGSLNTQGPVECYLDLLKKVLTREIVSTGVERHTIRPQDGPKSRLTWQLNKYLNPRDTEMVRLIRTTPEDFLEPGTPKTEDAETMLGTFQLDHMQQCIAEVLRLNVPGDLLEAGVWRGGMSIFMRASLKAYQVRDRKVILADSFAGLPEINRETETFSWQKGDMAVSLETVKQNFARYGLLDNQVMFLKGYFADTLPGAPIGRLSILRIDGDLYQSTMDALRNLYPALSPGGYALFDDYQNLPDCQRAIDEYRLEHGITEEIRRIDSRAVCWQKRLSTA